MVNSLSLVSAVNRYCCQDSVLIILFFKQVNENIYIFTLSTIAYEQHIVRHKKTHLYRIAMVVIQFITYLYGLLIPKATNNIGRKRASGLLSIGLAQHS